MGPIRLVIATLSWMALLFYSGMWLMGDGMYPDKPTRGNPTLDGALALGFGVLLLLLYRPWRKQAQVNVRATDPTRNDSNHRL